jgi:hypothetical protein
MKIFWAALTGLIGVIASGCESCSTSCCPSNCNTGCQTTGTTCCNKSRPATPTVAQQWASADSCGTGFQSTYGGCEPCACPPTPNLMQQWRSSNCNEGCQAKCGCGTCGNNCCPPTPNLLQQWRSNGCNAGCQDKGGCGTCGNNGCPPTPNLLQRWRSRWCGSDCQSPCNSGCSCQCGQKPSLCQLPPSGGSTCNCPTCQKSPGDQDCFRHPHSKCRRGNCNSCIAPCQPSQPTNNSSPCEPPSKPIYCNSCNRGLTIVQQPTGNTVTPNNLPSLATSVVTDKADDDSRNQEPASVADTPSGIRTLVGTLQYNPTTNIWRLRHLGISADDQKGGEVTLRGIEPYANSLRDKLTVSIRGELSGTNAKSQVMDFTVADVNIVGQ